MTETVTIAPRINHSDCFGASGKGLKLRTTRYADFSRQHTARVAFEAQREGTLEAAQNRVYYAGMRTPIERLERLDKRLGKGQGARKERAKLLALINAGKGDIPNWDTISDKEWDRLYGATQQRLLASRSSE